MQSIGDVLKKFNPTKDKYVSREFQSFGVHLAESLDDPKHKSLYIKMAKIVPRAILEKALSFVVDSNAKNKGALFMWKVTELRKGQKISPKNKSFSDDGKVNPNFKTKKVKVEQGKLL